MVVDGLSLHAGAQLMVLVAVVDIKGLPDAITSSTSTDLVKDRR
jgi:hypothetical protein